MDAGQSADMILETWAVRYDVSRERHETYRKLLREPLMTLYEKIPSGERYSWMDELGIKAKDTFSYVLSVAEQAYSNMHTTSKNVEIIKKNISLLHNDRLAEVLESLTNLSAGLNKGLSGLNKKFDRWDDER